MTRRPLRLLAAAAALLLSAPAAAQAASSAEFVSADGAAATSAYFEFISDPAGGPFECALDAAAFASCTSPVELDVHAVPEGLHTFHVRVTGETDEIAATFRVDRTAPALTFVSPDDGARVKSPSPQLFGEPGVADGDDVVVVRILQGAKELEQGTATLEATSWRFTPKALADGDYTAEVSQVDDAGNVKTLTRKLTIDTVAPDTSITAGPGAQAPPGDTTFTFAATEPGVRFQCSLDGGGYIGCPATKTYMGVPAGSHILRVRAVDAAGNADQSPAQRAWVATTTYDDFDFGDPGDLGGGDGGADPGDGAAAAGLGGSALDDVDFISAATALARQAVSPLDLGFGDSVLVFEAVSASKRRVTVGRSGRAPVLVLACPRICFAKVRLRLVYPGRRGAKDKVLKLPTVRGWVGGQDLDLVALRLTAAQRRSVRRHGDAKLQVTVAVTEQAIGRRQATRTYALRATG